MADKTNTPEEKAGAEEKKPDQFYTPFLNQLEKLNLPPFVTNKYFLVSFAVVLVIIVITVTTSISGDPIQVPLRQLALPREHP